MKHSLRLVLIPILLYCLFYTAPHLAPGAAQSRLPEGPRRGFGLGPEGPEPTTPHRPGAVASDPAAPAAQALILPNSRLVMETFRSGINFDLYLSDGNSTNPDRATSHPANEVQPDLNRGGTQIAFSSNSSEVYNIYSMSVTGGQWRMLTNYNKNTYSPAWSPDGSKIAYQTYADGNSEVYVMNADGTGKTRLTYTPGGYSGEPNWSPDGKQIVYTAYVNGGWRIWVMNADGSNPVQISQKSYSANPVWSPDGSLIAYNCMDPYSGVMEIHTISPTGAGDVYLMGSGSYYKDYLVDGWTPDMRNFIYTRVTYIVDNGALYWTEAQIFFKGLDGSGPVWTNALDDWYLDWKSLDAIRPQASLSALPAISPSPFLVSWAASDQGGSGLREIQVQVRDGAQGAWTTWIKTADAVSGAAYPGIGGHTYAFRIQAMDRDYLFSDWTGDQQFVTTVESEPPITKLSAVPAYIPCNFNLTWSGEDIGGSGILNYQLEYKTALDSPTWTVFAVTPLTSTVFYSSPGLDYWLRLRAVDKAQNMQARQNPLGYDAATEAVRYVVSGKVIDWLGNPLAGVDVQIGPDPETQIQVTSQADGSFVAPTLNYTFVNMNWHKNGYGSLPETSYTYVDCDSTNQLVVLPPANNLVQDPGFEINNKFGEPWRPGGDTPPTLGSNHLTGEKAARLFAENISTFTPVGPAGSDGSQIALDAGGVNHLVWIERVTHKIYYSQKAPGSDWTAPLLLFVPPQTYPVMDQLQVATASDGSLVVVWYGLVNYMAMHRTVDGIWTNPSPVTDRAITADRLVVDGQGNLHLAYQTATEVRYTRMDASGNWSTPLTLSQADAIVLQNPVFTVDSLDRVHVGWLNTATNQYMHMMRSIQGVWSSAEIINQWNSDCVQWNYTRMLAGAQGQVDVFWRLYSGCVNESLQTPSLAHKRLSSDGVWSPLEVVIPDISKSNFIDILPSPDGGLHLGWVATKITDSQELRYLRMSPQGVWGADELVKRFPGRFYNEPQMVVDTQNNLHVMWLDPRWYGKSCFNCYLLRTPDGWVDYGLISTDEQAPGLAVTNIGVDSAGHLLALAVLPDLNDPQGPDWLQVIQPIIPMSDRVTYLEQSVVLPADMDHPVLSFAYQLQGATPANSASLDVLASQSGMTTTLFSASQDTFGWVHQALDLSAFKGQAVNIRFTLYRNKYQQPHLYLDDVSIAGTPPDVWVSGWLKTAQPNSQVVYTLSYGNRSSGMAPGVVLTHTLPAELTLVSASEVFTQSGSTLRFELGDLPGKMYGTIYITATLPTRLKSGAILLGSLEIGTQAAELELTNNYAVTRIYYGRLTYLPVLRR